MSTLTNITMPSASLCWRLDGPAGPGMDALVATAIGAGISVEAITAGTAYRLDGSALLLKVLADELQAAEGYSLAVERAPTDAVSVGVSCRPAFTPVRNIVLHGQPAMGWVRAAVDVRLTVTAVGIQRWNVTGPSTDLVTWYAAANGMTTDEVLTLWQMTAADLKAEDAAPLAVSINLPNRQTTSTITRDADGSISQIVQLETTP